MTQRNKYLTEALRGHLADIIMHGGEPTINDEYAIEWSTPDTPRGDWLRTNGVMPDEEDIAAARRFVADLQAGKFAGAASVGFIR